MNQRKLVTLIFLATLTVMGLVQAAVRSGSRVAEPITSNTTIIDATVTNTLEVVGVTPTFTIGDGGAEDIRLLFDGNVLDAYLSVDDSNDLFSMGSGTTAGLLQWATADATGFSMIRFSDGTTQTTALTDTNSTTINNYIDNTVLYEIVNNEIITYVTENYTFNIKQGKKVTFDFNDLDFYWIRDGNSVMTKSDDAAFDYYICDPNYIVNGSLDVNGVTTFNAVTGFGETTANGESSTADTIDWTAGNIQSSTLTGDCTYTFTDPSVSCHLTLIMTQDGTGSRNPSWPANVYWADDTEPTWTTTAGDMDVVSFIYDVTADKYYGAGTTGFNP